MSTNQRAHDLDREYVFHSWSAQAALDPMVIAGGLGTEVWDFEGNRYLDFSSQLVNVNIGHQHPKLVAAIQEAAGTLCTIAPFHANEARSEAARAITEVANGDRAAEWGERSLDMVFFTEEQLASMQDGEINDAQERNVEIWNKLKAAAGA